VRDPVHRAEAVVRVAHVAAQLGRPAHGVARSRLPGPSGNVEFFLWLRRGEVGRISDDEITRIVTSSEGVEA
jgi:23S rRNA (cytidine1920-2'-O)/16S rRNA (cytidine1409-2'-O)-methyltransferase